MTLAVEFSQFMREEAELERYMGIGGGDEGMGTGMMGTDGMGIGGMGIGGGDEGMQQALVDEENST